MELHPSEYDATACPTPKYTLNQASLLCCILEAIAKTYALHLAIAGSCAYQGHSDNDIDLILYPHSGGAPDVAGFLQTLPACNIDTISLAGSYSPDPSNLKIVLATTWTPQPGLDPVPINLICLGLSHLIPADIKPNDPTL